MPTQQKKQESLIIDSAAVNEIIQKIGLNRVMDDLILNLENALGNFDHEKTSIPVRDGFNYLKPHLGLVEWMPLMQSGEEVIIKVVGYHPQNPKLYKLPTILSTISSYDSHTGHLNSLVDGVLLTALRTGASSAIATKMMANPTSETLGIIGCGAQSVTQIHAISRLFDIQEILVYDTDFDSMNSLEDRISMLELDIKPRNSSLEEIMENSDIVCTATSIAPNQGPLFDNLNYKEDLHINAVGADFPGKFELPKSLLEQAFVCPDFLTQALKEGECQQIPENRIGPSWVELYKSPEAQSESRKMISVFDSTGWALEDKVVSDLFAHYAQSLGLGTQMILESYTEDEKSPYGLLNVLYHMSS